MEVEVFRFHSMLSQVYKRIEEFRGNDRMTDDVPLVRDRNPIEVKVECIQFDRDLLYCQCI